MTSKNWTDSATLFKYASGKAEIWRSLKGARLTHNKWGQGVMLEVEVVDEKSVRFHVQFSDDAEKTGQCVRMLGPKALEINAITEITIPSQLWELLRNFQGAELENQQRQQAQRRQRALEAGAVEEFKSLKQKYGVMFYSDDSPVSPLYAILLKLESKRDLFIDEVAWLEDEELFHPVLAVYYQQRGLLAKAGSEWRRAGKPSKALEITDREETCEDSMILTMRGGAYRDLQKLNRAEFCANKAIKIQPDSHYPWNLLGAVYYQRGNIEKGEGCFQRAQSLGSGEREIDRSIRSAVDNMTDAARRQEVARYLLEKDPQRYSWAEHYLSR